MRLLAPRLAAVLTAVALAFGASATAQDDPTRFVFVPFDADASIEALALAVPAVLQHAFNELDGTYAPPVGDAGLVLQRLIDAGRDDALELLAAAFDADVLVLGRASGSEALVLELVVVVDGEERTARVEGRLGDLTALWTAAADAVLRAADRAPSSADRAALLDVLGDAPSLPSLGPLATAAARLPGVRVDQLEAAAALDPSSAWARSELARTRVLAGDAARAVADADEAVALRPSVEVLTTQGVVRLVAGDATGAATAFTAALERNASHAVALVGLAQTVPAAERAALLARAAAAAPRQVDAQLGLASLQTSASGAIQALRRAAESLPDSPSVLAALVDVTVGAGDARGALDLLRAVAGRPLGRTPAAYTAAGRLPESVAGDALAFVREGVALFPEASDLRLLEAELLRRSGDAVGSEAALRAAVDANPDSITDVRALARLLAERGAGEEAQALWATVADRAPDAALTSAELDLASGRSRAALATLEPLVAAGGADVDLRTLYGIALGRVGRVDEARAALTAVLQDEPDAILAARALALLEEQGRVTGETALELGPDAAAAFERGLTALELGEFARAADAFAEARSLQDEGLLAFYEGYARQRAGDPRSAIAAYDAARTTLGDQDVLLNNLGYAHLQVGRFDRALDALTAAVAANPGNARAHLNLGLTYYATGRFGEAVASFDRALELDPTLEASAADAIADARERAAP
jgi:tetratricopeptide (TPR) repeat protein